MSGLEVPGFIIGISGLGAVFDKACAIWWTICEAKDFGNKVADAMSKLEMEFFRFQAWWAVLDKLAAAPRTRPKSPIPSSLPTVVQLSGFEQVIEHPVVNATNAVVRLLTELETILSKNGALDAVKQSKSAIPSTSAAVDLASQTKERGARYDALAKDLLKSVPFFKRVKFSAKPWTVTDSEKVDKIISDFIYWNKALYRILPFSIRESVIRHGISGYILSSNESALSLANVSSSDVHNAVTIECAQLILLRERLRTSPTKTMSQDLQNDLALMRKMDNASGRILGTRGIPSSGEHFSVLTYKDGRGAQSYVLLEWYAYPPARTGLDAWNIARDRMARLAYLLQKQNRPATLHSLDSIGYVESANTKAFGLISKLPDSCAAGTTSETLYSLLSPKPTTASLRRPRPTLEERYELAAVLASSLYTFMLSGWHHKRFHSSSIYFLSSASQPSQELPDITKPLVGGYAISRPDSPGEDTFPGMPLKDTEMYLHPELRTDPNKAHQTFHRAYEIYGFGILLAEIGLWTTMPTFALDREDRNKNIGPSELRAKILRECKRSLACWMGERYRDIVLQCLGVNQQDNLSQDLNYFYWNIVLELTKCGLN